MILHAHRIMLAPCERFDGVRLFLVFVTQENRIPVIRHAVELCAELPIVHHRFSNHRIQMFFLRRMSVRLIERNRLSGIICLKDICAVRIRFRRAVLLIDQLVFRLLRCTNIDCPRIGTCRPEIADVIVRPAAVERAVIPKGLEFRPLRQPFHTVIKEFRYRPERHHPGAAPVHMLFNMLFNMLFDDLHVGRLPAAD